MKKFNKRYEQIMEDGAVVGDIGNTTSSALGPTQGHSAQIGKSGDFYAPGDTRKLFGAWVSKKKKNTKFKPPGFKKGKVIRRTLPSM